jgi:selenocysteine-specific elongation factor
VATFRDHIGTGRKLAIQILEFFDRSGMTVREGDLRRTREDRLAMFRSDSE